MQISEFVNATNRLESYFGKEYSTEQRKIMFEILEEWNLQTYIKAINYCIRNCKYLPKISDLTNADLENRIVQKTEDIEFVKCNKCNGEGFIKYFRNTKDGDRTLTYEYIALCTCQNAEKQRQINKYKFPTLAELGI